MALPRIEGYAIVSSDGMLADAQGVMPPGLFFDADQDFFHRGVERASALVHGRHSHERYPPTAGKPRLIATRSVAALARDPDEASALLWNPAGATVAQAWDALGITGGVLVVIGGTEIFGLFLPYYDAFHLSRAPGITLPGGRPVFPQVPAQTPEQMLRAHGLAPGPERALDPARGLTLVTWERQTGNGVPRPLPREKIT
jgi:dihydrofolate reductase